MEHNQTIKFSSDAPDGAISRENVVNAVYDVIRTRIKKGHRAAKRLKIEVFSTKEEWRDYFEELFIWPVDAMFKISNQRFHRFYLPTIVAQIELIFNEISDSGKMSVRVTFSGDYPSREVVKNPQATRRNEVDGSIDVFDNVGELHGMGLKFKMDERNPMMTVLWQFNGKAKEDIQESLRVSITGGAHEATLDKTTTGENSYSVLRMQDHLILRGTHKTDIVNNDLDVLYIKSCGIEGDILEATFDYNTNIWKYRLCQDVTIDDDTRFASETEYDLIRKTMITVGDISIRLDPKGRPTRHKKLFGLL